MLVKTLRPLYLKLEFGNKKNRLNEPLEGGLVPPSDLVVNSLLHYLIYISFIIRIYIMVNILHITCTLCAHIQYFYTKEC